MKKTKIPNLYIVSLFIPLYKRLVLKFKLWYDKYINWKYGIEIDNNPVYMRELSRQRNEAKQRKDSKGEV